MASLINPAHAFNMVWDVNTLLWVSMVQPFSSGPLTAVITNDGTFAKETGGNLATLVSRAPALGQALAAASTPVVLTAAQVTTLTPPPAITGFALEAGHLATIDSNIALIKAKTDNLDVALSTRTKPADAQHVIVDSSAAIAVTGPLTDAQLRAVAVPISAATLPLPSGAATEATLVSVGTNTAATVANLEAANDELSAIESAINGLEGVVAKETGGNLASAASSLTTVSGTVKDIGEPLTAKALVIQGDGSGNMNPVVVTGSVGVLQPSASNLHTAAEVYQGGQPVTNQNPLLTLGVSTILAPDTDAGYTLPISNYKYLVQTPEGRLRVSVAGVARAADSDTLSDGQERTLSLTTDGRLRVATSPSEVALDFFSVTDIVPADSPWADLDIF